MKVIQLDATNWRTPDDFYSALLTELGAPEWHGRNLDALEESLRDCDINRVNPPFRVEVKGSSGLTSDMLAFLARVASVFLDVRTRDGVEVSIVLQ